MHAMENAVRNSTKIHADLKLVNDEKTAVTKGGCFIYIPEGYIAKELAFIGNTIDIVGVFAITTDRKSYGVSSCTSVMEITPDSYSVVTINDEPYYEFCFLPGSIVFPNLDIAVIPGYIYNLTSYVYDYGNRPFWVDPKDDAELLSSAPLWNGIRVFGDQSTADIFAAQTQRVQGDPESTYRHSLKRGGGKYKPLYIPLRDGPLNKTSRLAKIADVELKRGIRSALKVQPTRAEPLEDLYMR